MAYMVSANMDQGSKDFQIEAAISKIFGSVRLQACREGEPHWSSAPKATFYGSLSLGGSLAGDR